jgi:hypothetical protein
MRGEQLNLYDTRDDTPEVEEGVSVSVDARRVALKALATLYGDYNRAEGFNKAIHRPSTRRQLQRRYSDVDDVAVRMQSKSAGILKREAELMKPLTQEEALAEAGFDDTETTAQLVTIEVRSAIGTGVKAAARQQTLRSIY